MIQKNHFLENTFSLVRKNMSSSSIHDQLIHMVHGKHTHITNACLCMILSLLHHLEPQSLAEFNAVNCCNLLNHNSVFALSLQLVQTRDPIPPRTQPASVMTVMCSLPTETLKPSIHG